MFSSLLSAALLLSSADIPHESVQAFQNHIGTELFHKNTKRSQRKTLTLDEILEKPNGSPDICRWRGIRCEEGKMNAIFLENMGLTLNTLLLSIEWLPPTVQFVHLVSLRLTAGWLVETLPRDLKYFYIESCMSKEHEAHGHSINLRRLPHQTEEFHVISSYRLYGKFDLTQLPSTLRVLALTTTLCALPGQHPTVIVDYGTLPENFLGFVIGEEPGEVKVRTIGRLKSSDATGKHVLTERNGVQTSVYSCYVTEYMELCRRENG